MESFDPTFFITFAVQAGQLFEQARCGQMVAPASWKELTGTIKGVQYQARKLNLTSTLAQLQRIENILSSESINTAYLMQSLIEVVQRINDDLSEQTVFLLPDPLASFLDKHGFSTSAMLRFPDAEQDMREAALCFAFSRSTACVFHLMRVTEHSLLAIADLLLLEQKNLTWDPIIRKIDAELKADYKHRKFKGSQDLLATVSSHLHAVKVAWRNPTMHVEKSHSPEQAKAIYDATVGLLGYLGDSLPLPSKGLMAKVKGLIS